MQYYVQSNCAEKCFTPLYRHHCWASFEGSAEIYNEVMRETRNYNFINSKQFLEKHACANAAAIEIGI